MQVPRLGELRARAFLTQESLAERSGVSRDTISKLETGERINAHARTVAKLAKALDVEPWELQSQLPPPEPFPEDQGRKDVDGGASFGKRLRDRWRSRKVELNVNESQLESVLDAYMHTVEEQLPEETPSEAYLNLVWMALVVQGLGYEEARARAQELVYGSEKDLKNNGDLGV